ncbi:MAG: hypothetical protein ACOH18_02665 [Candidatus Saccharimonadaceae bacterium]
MARLPTPGEDNEVWGGILNDFLSQVHDQDGMLKSQTVGSSQIKPAAIQSAHLASGVLDKSAVGLGNVDNTSDNNKPVSNATLTALNAKVSSANLDTQTATNIANTSSATAIALIDVINDATASPGPSFDYTNLPSGVTLTIFYDTDTGWPARPTNRTDLTVHWIGGDENNSPTDAAVGCDLWERPVS